MLFNMIRVPDGKQLRVYSTCPLLGKGMFILVPPSLIVSSVVCAYTPRPRPDKESRGRERGTPRTIGMPYRRASQSEREALYGNGIPVWFCLAWNLLCSDSSILTSISPCALFLARDIMLRKQKSRPPKTGERLEKGVEREAPFLKIEKAGISMAATPHKFRLIHI